MYKPIVLFDQAATEKVAKQLQQQLNEVQGKLDETNRTLNDFDSAKKKLSIENSDLLRQLEEAESQVSQLSKIKISLTTQLEDTKRLADEESRVSQYFCPLVDKEHSFKSRFWTRSTFMMIQRLFLSLLALKYGWIGVRCSKPSQRVVYLSYFIIL